MTRLPIRLRVTLAFAAVMAVLLAALGSFVYFRFERDLDETIDQALSSGADNAAQQARAKSSLAGFGEANPLEPEEDFGQILTPAGRVVEGTSQLEGSLLSAREAAAVSARGRQFYERDRVAGLDPDPARLLARPIDLDGRARLVVVGTALDDRNDSLASLRGLLLVGGPVALLLASLAGYAMAGAALRPIERMRERAATISASQPGERLPVSNSGDEVARLGETLNAMLARLEAALEREQAFVADAGHELRTPLALLKAELELALRHERTREGLERAIRSASEEVDRLTQLSQDLLVVAQSDEGKLAVELAPVSVDELFEHLRNRFASRAADAEREIEVERCDGLQVDADALRIEQALGNLVDNSLRYGDGAISLSAGRRGGHVELHVRDRGTGFPPEFLDQAFERFTRADTARTRGGTGLGLAIVEAIARAHGGRALAANDSRGGADVWLTLPGGR
jgi:two-component system, OmpR family, sensor kinase